MNIIVFQADNPIAPTKSERQILFEEFLTSAGLPLHLVDNFLYFDSVNNQVSIVDSSIDSIVIASLQKQFVPIAEFPTESKTKTKAIKVPVDRPTVFQSEHGLMTTDSGTLDVTGMSSMLQPFDASISKLHNFGPYVRDFYPNYEYFFQDDSNYLQFDFANKNTKTEIFNIRRYAETISEIDGISYPLIFRATSKKQSRIIEHRDVVSLTPNMEIIFDALQESNKYSSLQEIYELFCYRSMIDLFYILNRFGYEYVANKIGYIKKINQNRTVERLQRNRFAEIRLEYITKNQASLRMFGVPYIKLPEAKRAVLNKQTDYSMVPIFAKLSHAVSMGSSDVDRLLAEVFKKYPQLKDDQTGIIQVDGSGICSHIIFQATHKYGDLLDNYGMDTDLGKCCRYCGQVIGIIDQNINIDSVSNNYDEFSQTIWMEAKKILLGYVEFSKDIYIPALVTNISDMVNSEISAYNSQLMKSQTSDKQQIASNLHIYTVIYIIAVIIFYINNNRHTMNFKRGGTPLKTPRSDTGHLKPLEEPSKHLDQKNKIPINSQSGGLGDRLQSTGFMGGAPGGFKGGNPPPEDLRFLADLVNTGFSYIMRYVANYIKESSFDEQIVKNVLMKAIKWISGSKKLNIVTGSTKSVPLANDAFYQYLYRMYVVKAVLAGKPIPEFTDYNLILGRNIEDPGNIFSDIDPPTTNPSDTMLIEYAKYALFNEASAPMSVRLVEFYKKFDTSADWKRYRNTGSLARLAGVSKQIPKKLLHFKVEPGFLLCPDRKKHLFNIVKTKTEEIPKKKIDTAASDLDFGFFRTWSTEKIIDKKCSKCGTLMSDAESLVVKEENKQKIFFEMFSVACPVSDLSHVYEKGKCVRCGFHHNWISDSDLGSDSGVKSESSEEKTAYFKQYQSAMSRKKFIKPVLPEVVKPKSVTLGSTQINSVAKLANLIKVDSNIIINIGTNIGRRFEQIEKNETSHVINLTDDQKQTRNMFLFNYINQLIQYSYVFANMGSIFEIPELIKTVLAEFKRGSDIRGKLDIKKEDLDPKIRVFAKADPENNIGDPENMGSFLLEFMADYLLHLYNLLDKEERGLGLAFIKAFIRSVIESEKNVSKPIIALIKRSEYHGDDSGSESGSENTADSGTAAESETASEESENLFEHDMDIGDEEDNLETNL